nr:hypothetical protein [Tanacetum cinerariifolium]
VVSRHQATQQYGAILPIELTTNEIRNSKAYQEYYACAMGEATPKPKASARKKKGDSASSTTTHTPTPTTTAESAPRLSAHETHISQQSGSGTGEGTDEEVGGQDEGNESNDDSDDGSDKDSEETVKSGAGKASDEDDDEDDDDDDDEEEETATDDKESKETGKGGDQVREKGESESESDDEEEQESRHSEEARIREEEDAEELYHDVNINQARGLQITQSMEDTHVILTPVNPDDQQESSSMSSFVSKSEGESDEEETRQEEEESFDPILRTPEESEEESNDEEEQDLRLSDEIFTTASFPIVSLETPTPIMTPSTIATITTSGASPILPPTIPIIILENLPMFNSAFRFEERLRSLETSFFEYRQTNPFTDAVSAIPDIVHQYMTQQITKAVREAV